MTCFDFADSRRLYYKKKQQKAELQEAIQQLCTDNERLRRDNARLESLLAEAQLHTTLPFEEAFMGAGEQPYMGDLDPFQPIQISSQTLSV